MILLLACAIAPVPDEGKDSPVQVDGALAETSGYPDVVDPDPDADGDGVPASVDCNDQNPAVFPGAAEVCNTRDDDCNGLIDEAGGSTWFVDADLDGFGGESFVACDGTGAVLVGGDCDDMDGTVFPDAIESCNGTDDNCDGAIDEGLEATWFVDGDRDGFGDTPIVTCDRGTAVAVDGDCDDADAAVFPGAAEVCNDVDDDCNGAIDEAGGSVWFVDADHDGFGDLSFVACDGGDAATVAGDCDDGEAAVSPAAAEICNDRDDNCDGAIDEGVLLNFYADLDRDGFGGAPFSACEAGDGVTVAGDCDDTDAGSFPGATEACNGHDDDCNGAIDEAGGATWYVDADGDGIGSTTFVACDAGDGVEVAGDCDDADAAAWPGNDERCDSRDNDCDGFVDEDDSIDQATWYLDRDGDGFGDPATALGACDAPSGRVADNTDCDDDLPYSYPGAMELVDGHDNDCDGVDAGPCEPLGASTTVLLGDSVDLTLGCTNVDEGQRLSLTGATSGMSWDATAHHLTWTPTQADIGRHDFLVGDDDETAVVSIDVQDSDQVVFDATVMHRVDIEITSAAMTAINAVPTDWQEANFTFDGERFESVGIRATGRLGSARDFPSKVAMKVDLNKMGVDQDLHGLQRLDLHNMVQDCAKVKELASYGAHRLLGVPAPRVVYTQVYLNAVPYGVYSVVEEYDDEFLEKNFDDPSGNLYDGDYYLYPDWSSYILVDFLGSTQVYFDLDEGTDIDLADVQAVTRALHEGSFSTDVAELVDLDNHAAFLAANAWTGQYDSYSYYRNNYRVYFDPERDNQVVFLPWDPDWAFYAYTPVTSGYGAISSGCLADTSCRTAARAYADQLSDEIPDGELQAEVEAAIALIDPYLATDPKLESSLGSIHACQVDMLDWFSRRGAEMDAAGF